MEGKGNGNTCTRVLNLGCIFKSSGELLKSPVPRLHSRSTESESLGVGSRHQGLVKLSR